MVFTLHRYIFRELLKVFVLAGVALTLILSLGSILQPVQQHGVGPRQVLHLMVYFLPITLTFVLPMAALFASALVYGRFAFDNELEACKASGISLSVVVYPGFALAIVVAIANLLLSFHVMPYFVHLAEVSVKADAKQILFRNIERTGYYELPDDRHYIYADEADFANNTLLGVVVADAKYSRMEKIITAESAKIEFLSHQTYNEVRIITYNTFQLGSENEGGFSMKWGSFSTEFGPLLGDEIKFKKADQMKRIRADLMRFYPVAKLARQVYAQLAAELLAQDIRAKAKANPGGSYRLYSAEKYVDFTATDCLAKGDSEVELSGDVVVVESDIGGAAPARRLRCAKALLHTDAEGTSPTLTMDVYHARIEDSGEMPMRYIIRGLIVPESVQSVMRQFKTEGNLLKPRELSEPVSALGNKAGDELTKLQTELGRRIGRTLMQIASEMQSRLVFGIGCIPMILIGIGLGILKRGGHLLTAFGASCVPAAVLIVCIMSGKNVAENPDSNSGAGIALMWAGLAFLLLLAGFLYMRLLKH
jgi:lipopolysaccharide export LptBFGC system permease protein LptF